MENSYKITSNGELYSSINRLMLDRSDPFFQYVFSDRFVHRVSIAVSNELFRILKRKIRVTDNNIRRVIDNHVENASYMPEEALFDSIVSTIVTVIVDEDGVINNNNELDPIVLLRLPESGLSPVSQIKLKKKRGTTMIFNMNY